VAASRGARVIESSRSATRAGAERQALRADVEFVERSGADRVLELAGAGLLARREIVEVRRAKA
jgi:hypothetical protein